MSVRGCGFAALAVALLAGPSIAATIDDVAFLAGEWRGEGFGGTVEERWSEPLGDSMLGTFRIVAGGALKMTEYLTILEEDGGVVLRFEHYSRDYGKLDERTLVLRLVESRPGLAVFEGEQDAPGKMVYELADDGTLRVRVENVGEKAGEAFELVFHSDSDVRAAEPEPEGR